ncbi:hypothetical protein F2Q69_00045433 [Brassica cretica]|uniref:Ubiquitin-like domain-containing protein n=1 Tax=Brassica cretica TaxID=69181 RepID=A0A8S9NAA5_BRACR|nr:hypothetical protein F2Q69_00045433 [Brassica cretica]
MSSSSEDDPNIDPEVRFIMEGTARLVAKHGLWMESRFLEDNCPEGMNPNDFGVIKLTAQFVVRGQRVNLTNMLAKKHFSKHDEEEGVEIERDVADVHDFSGCLDYFACSDDGKWKSPGRISAQMLSDGMLDAPPTDDDAQGQPNPLFTDPPIPRDYPFTYPKGITRRQLGIIKVTAQFYVRYGYAFWMALKRRLAIINNSQLNAQFKFIMLVTVYSNVLMPSCTCPERAVLKGFFNLLQGENQEVEVGVEMSESDLHSYVVALDYFANREDQQLTSHGCFSSTPTQMHLKEKIARKIQIPANKQKLWGKAGFLKKDNMSLAHYCVGAGETLIMSL